MVKLNADTRVSRCKQAKRKGYAEWEDAVPHRGDGNESDDDGQAARELQSVPTVGMRGASNWVEAAGSCGIGWYAEAVTAGR